MPRKDKESAKEYKREYYIRNKEQIKAKTREWEKNNYDKIKERRKKNEERDKLRRKKYYDENKLKLSDYKKQKYYNDIEKSRENSRKNYNRNREHQSLHSKESARKRKQIFIEMYGGKCACCGITDIQVLTLDHINNNGNELRKNTTNHKEIYKAIEDYRPDLYQVLCSNCNESKHRNHGKCWHQEPIDKRNLKTIDIWNKIFELYGNCCIMCGETNPTSLEIDHINNDGKGDRTRGFYQAVSDYNPKKYQLLCSNCNKKKSYRKLFGAN